MSRYYKKKCRRCGGNPVTYNEYGELKQVSCDNCGLSTLEWNNVIRAVENWNTLQEKLTKESPNEH